MSHNEGDIPLQEVRINIDSGENVNTPLVTGDDQPQDSNSSASPPSQEDNHFQSDESLHQDEHDHRSGDDENKDTIIVETELKPRRMPTFLDRLLIRDDFIAMFLTILGIITAGTSLAMDAAIEKMRDFHYFLGTEASSYGFINFVLFVLFMMGCVIAGVLVTVYISNGTAAGSGIPEMKVILSGTSLNQYLSFRTLVAKVLGLVATVGGGLFVGKEGPFVHTASIIANQLLRIKIFRKLRENEGLKQQLLASACAVGVAANFGAPIGGVLFSIEVTSTYYPVRNYWYSFTTSVAGAFAYRLFYNLYFKGSPNGLAPIFSADGEDYLPKFDVVDIILCCLLGAVGGLAGAFFIKFGHWVVEYRRKFRDYKWAVSPYPYALVITFITAVFAFPPFFPFFWSQYGEMKTLFTQMNLPAEWYHYNLYFSLIFFFVLRVLLTSAAKSIHTPSGLLVPTLTTGAALGRVLGEFMRWAYDSDPLIYTLVGAAAFSSGVTQTVSSYVFVMELTGRSNMLFPYMITVLIAMRFSGFITISVYDLTLKERGLPYLPDLHNRTYNLLAQDIMTSVECLVKGATPQQVVDLLQTTDYALYPVVDSLLSRTLIGCATREQLMKWVYDYFRKFQPKESYVGDTPRKKKKRGVEGDIFNEEARDTMKDLKKFLQNLPKAERAMTPSTERRVAMGVPPSPGRAERPPRPKSGMITTSVDLHTAVDMVPEALRKDYSPLPMKPAPIQLLLTTPLTQIHLLFITFRLSHVFVTDHGKLVGMVTRKDLKNVIQKS